MEIFAQDLKIGDKVNCHEHGWLIVRNVIRRPWDIEVQYDDDPGNLRSYYKDEKVFIVR